MQLVDVVLGEVIPKSLRKSIMSDSKFRGHCYCGDVQFDIDGEPKWISHCHCESCRRHTASVVATYASFGVNQVKFTRTLPVSHSTENGIIRSFCGKCGSPVSYESNKNRAEGNTNLYLGIFDEPEMLIPQEHGYYREHVAWLNIDDGLTRNEGLSEY